MDAILGIGLITAAAIGEFAAFDALAGHPTHSNRVAAELGTGFAGLFLYGDLVWSQVRGYTSHNPKAWHRRVLTAGAVTLIGMGALLLTLFWLSVLG